MTKHRSQSIILAIISLMLFCFTSNRLIAQQDFDIKLNIDTFSVGLPVWSVDSNQFAFRAIIKELPAEFSIHTELNLEDELWWTYDLDTKQLIPYKSFPFVSDEIKSHLATSEFIYESPDKRFALFQILPHVDGLSEIAIANLITDEIFRTGIQVTNRGLAPEEIQVFWSENSRNLVFGQVKLGTSHIYHLQVSETLTDIVVREFSLSFDGKSYYTFEGFVDQVYDISNDGRYVLLVARENRSIADPYNDPKKLIIWDTISPETSIISDLNVEEIASVSLASNNASGIIYFDNKAQIKYYDTSTSLTETIRDDLDLTSSGVNHFSPDGKWITIHYLTDIVFDKIQLNTCNSPTCFDLP